MNYIGSKHKLSAFIKETIFDTVGKDLSDYIFCDLFAGTGSVGRNFKSLVKEVISNDLEYYSYVLNRHYIGNNKLYPEVDSYIETLNNTPGKADFIFRHYCKGGDFDRQYFSDENGSKIDAIRFQIEQWKIEKTISDDVYFYLLTSLLEAADKVANTASVYGAYLKHLKTSAQKTMRLAELPVAVNGGENIVYNQDSNRLIYNIKGDILYLDPPYNARQYGANYHILNTIAKNDRFEPKGKTGLREYAKSNYCKTREVEAAFEDIIAHAQFKYVFLSYNNEGLMSVDKVKEIMSRYGQYSLKSTAYQRFKADTDANRNHTAKETQEYLHILVKG